MKEKAPETKDKMAQEVIAMLHGRALSFREIANQLGITIRRFEEEYAIIEEFQRRKALGEKVRLDIHSQRRLNLVDTLTNAQNQNLVTIALNLDPERAVEYPPGNSACYYLISQRDELFKKGVIFPQLIQGRLWDVRADFEESMERKRFMSGHRIEKVS